MDVSKEDFLLKGSQNKLIAATRYYNSSRISRKFVVFVHGFKGFKDWGTFPLLAKYICEAGFSALFFNFSHNGISPTALTYFDEKEAFAENTFSYEVADLKEVLEHLSLRYNPQEIHLLAHSRGAISALIAGEELGAVKTITTLAGVLNLEDWLKKYDLEKWKKEGHLAVINSRTGEELRMNYSLYEDFLKNKGTLEPAEVLKRIEKPVLMITADEDPIIDDSIAQGFAQINKNLKHVSIAKTAHTFGGKEPWEEARLPHPLETAVQQTLEFIEVSQG